MYNIADETAVDDLSSLSEFTFDRQDFTNPIVYVYYQRRVPLFVGYSRQGLHRPFLPRADKADARRRADQIQVYVFEQSEDAQRWEEELIYRYKPQYNLQEDVKLDFYQQDQVFDLKTMQYCRAADLLSGVHDQHVQRVQAYNEHSMVYKPLP